MKSPGITIKHSCLVACSPDTLWDYTQDYTNRHLWDQSVLQAVVLETNPKRVVKLRVRGGSSFVFAYKLDERPNRTALASISCESWLIESAGGAWTYQAHPDGTLWTQTNTLRLKPGIISMLLRPIVQFVFAIQTKNAMRKAKKLIESTHFS